MALTKSWWQSVVSRWWVVSPYSRWDVRDQAEADGALSPPVPGPDDPIAPWYVGAMKEHFDNIVRGILANFQEEDESHRLAISQLESDESAAREALCRTKKAYDLNPAHSPSRNVGQEANWRPSEAILVS